MINCKKIIPILFLTTLFLSGFSQQQQATVQDKTPHAKYVFYFIGDGMGLAHTTLTEAYMAALEGKTNIKPLNMSSFPVHSYATTFCNNRFITGSAAAGTALATGHKTSVGTISMSADHTVPLTSIAEMAHQQGHKVGIITSVSIDHATPAVFYAHQPKRSNYFEIGNQLIHTDFDFFGGGGFKKPQGSIGNKQVDLYDALKSNNFQLINTVKAFKKLKPSAKKTMVVNPVLDRSAAMPYVIDQTQEQLSLAQITSKAIELLDNPNGFFIMVEGGRIDWAAHSNDAATLIHEVLAFDQAVQQAINFYTQHPDETLIVVTADHETGGLGLGWAGTHYDSHLELLQYQTISSDNFSKNIAAFRQRYFTDNLSFKDMMPIITQAYGLGDSTKNLALNKAEYRYLKNAFTRSMLNQKDRPVDDDIDILYGGYEPLASAATELLAHKAGISWTSFTHTGSPVPVRAMGQGADFFGHYLDNTDIAHYIMQIMQLATNE